MDETVVCENSENENAENCSNESQTECEKNEKENTRIIEAQCDDNQENKCSEKANDDTEATSYDPKNVHYEGDVAVYTDPKTGYQYTWNKETNAWEARSLNYGYEDDTHTYTDSDGITFFWDKEKSAWFPKINDDFMAQYQMNYGFIDNTTPTEEEKPKQVIVPPEKPAPKKAEKRKASEPTWFDLDERQNNKVYVSNLPLDITEEEFTELMQKYGIIMKDPHTQKLKIKLYTEPNSNILKGDAICSFVRVESVDLAIKLLDGTDLRGKKINVERAKFQMKGAYDPKLKPKAKRRKDKLKMQKMQEKLFDWRPEKMRGERSKHERIVIIRNVFDSSEFDKDVSLILEYQQDLRDECSKCGEVRKVIIYDRHPEGVAQVNMKDPESADACVLLLNNRWFGKRQLKAEIWDGKTKFKIAETDSQISERINEWDKFLEDENTTKENNLVQKSNDNVTINDNKTEST